MYEPDTITPWRFGPFIDLLAKYGYFGPGAKVGILLANDGSGNNEYLVNNLWKPALAALGITPVVYTWNEIENLSTGMGQASDEFQSAVLQFRAAGVNRVMFTPDGGDAAYLFPQVANSQQYTPRYAMSSISEAGFWPGGVPASQQANALNVSYTLMDLGTTSSSQLTGQVATNPMNANRAICNTVYSGRTGPKAPSDPRCK